MCTWLELLIISHYLVSMRGLDSPPVTVSAYGGGASADTIGFCKRRKKVYRMTTRTTNHKAIENVFTFSPSIAASLWSAGVDKIGSGFVPVRNPSSMSMSTGDQRSWLWFHVAGAR